MATTGSTPGAGFDASRKDAEKLAADYDAVKRDLGQLRDEFAALLGHLREGAGHAADDVTRTARQQVEARPFTSLVVAFAAGFLGSLICGKLLR
jgi:hypothetical protein